MQMKVIKSYFYLQKVETLQCDQWPGSRGEGRRPPSGLQCCSAAVSRSDLMDCLQCCCITESSHLLTPGWVSSVSSGLSRLASHDSTWSGLALIWVWQSLRFWLLKYVGSSQPFLISWECSEWPLCDCIGATRKRENASLQFCLVSLTLILKWSEKIQIYIKICWNIIAYYCLNSLQSDRSAPPSPSHHLLSCWL